MFFIECLYFCEYDILIFLFVFWLRNRPSIKYVRDRGNGGGHPKCVQVRTGGGEVEEFVIRYVYTKWKAPNKFCGIFFVHWFGHIH